jgi:translation initiation factor IF-2
MSETHTQSKTTASNRPPIVAILGHVDHGKTTLLDYIRKAHVAAREAGGITQSIGAYQAFFKDRLLTFIDTPGHAAFSKMRSRGATVADLAVLVVAADDGVMPQTIESVKHIKAAGIPFVVAVNKVDKEGATPELPKAQLTEHEVFVEGYGGNVPVVPISGKTGQGVDNLLETLLLLADLEELTDESQSSLLAPIIESKLDVARGPIISVIVKQGVLRVGDTVYVGSDAAKVKAMFGDQGQAVTITTPAQPVQLLGFKSVPKVGEIVMSTPSTSSSELPQSSELQVPVSATPAKTLKIILRADTAGSLEAILGSFTEEIEVMSSGTGDVTEGDVLLAVTTGALVLGFNVKIPGSVAKLAETEGVTIKPYKIIYELLEYLEKKVIKLMEPTIDEDEIGKAVIVKVFEINGDKIAGSRVESGRFEIGDTIHLKKADGTVKDARVKSLRIGKEEMKKVPAGSECGILFFPNLDLREKDVIIAYKKIQTEE